MSALPEVPTPREHLVGAYLTNMLEFLKIEFPQTSEADLKSFIKKEVAARSSAMIERLNCLMQQKRRLF